jgi:hypothetical protein
MVVFLLIVSVEGLHTGFQLSGDGQFKGLVRGPVASCEDRDLELRTRSTHLVCGVTERLELLGLFTSQTQVCQHTFKLLGELRPTTHLDMGDHGAFIVLTERLFIEETFG